LDREPGDPWRFVFLWRGSILVFAPWLAARHFVKARRSFTTMALTIETLIQGLRLVLVKGIWASQLPGALYSYAVKQ